MSNLETYCITHSYLPILDDLSVIPIVAGSHKIDKSRYPKHWIKDDEGVNISKKNKHFGSLTSHYWFWKNRLKTVDKNKWIGFCHYRRYWLKEEKNSEINKTNIKQYLLTNVPEECNQYDALLCNPLNVSGVKVSKIFKRGFKNIIHDPSILFNKKKRTVKLHFDMFHGYGNLEKAAKLLNKEDKDDFINWASKDVEFYPLVIFVSKPEIMNRLYEKTFEWLFECEKIFPKQSLVGYGGTRMFDFLGERYFSFWFNKYAKITTWPWLFLDITK
tara:strand:+ start:271 stop:1089 length:819 start_codon:yes stop_codon:yes gene_type:complete